MKEVELDNWFFSLPACWQMDITAIYINEDFATDADYEKFDNAIAEWWDSLTHDEKVAIYENEEGICQRQEDDF